MHHYGLPSDGIPLDIGPDGLVVIHMVKGSHPAADYSEAKSANEIHQDVEKVMTAAGIDSGVSSMYIDYPSTVTFPDSAPSGGGATVRAAHPCVRPMRWPGTPSSATSSRRFGARRRDDQAAQASASVASSSITKSTPAGLR